MLAFIVGSLLIIPVIVYMSRDLPDYNQLMDYDPPTISRIYSQEGKLMAELAAERRIFTKIDKIPQLVKNAFIAAEDKNFYHHQGIDIMSILRATVQNISNSGSNKSPVGGSTITQQVVKNFLLTNERTITRKIKEAILAYRISQVYSKDRILELYLNQIYLGNGAYGVAMASLGYFNKDMKDLTIEEAAMIAAMPKAPSALDPNNNIQRAKIRRDWVIDRMAEEGFVTATQAEAAKSNNIKLNTRWDNSIQDSGYYTESVRLNIIEHFGANFVYNEGLSVFTNVDKNLQKLADETLREGLTNYDRRHGYRGPLGKIANISNWKSELAKVVAPAAIGSYKLAAVLSISDNQASIGMLDGSKATIPLENLKWARKAMKEAYIGKAITKASDVLSIGDVVLTDTNQAGATLEQIPEVNGALVVIEPKTGKILAMVGGYSFKESKYNRAIQAMRQPGSAFKPVVYLTALENGYLPTSIVNDAPVTVNLGPGQAPWTPKNYEGKFLGPITMRKALEKSRNTSTVRLITALGTKKVAETAVRLGIYSKLPPQHYSMALGSVETTPLKLTGAYAIFASNGLNIHPKLIDRIHDRKGNLIYSSEDVVCDFCLPSREGAAIDPNQLPQISFRGKYVVDPRKNFQMVSLLEGVVQRGTGVRAKSLNRPVAVKTGTSNESLDTWAIGFTPDLVVGVFVGYDAPKTLGKREQGASVALPIFVSFMQKALANMPATPFPVPEGIEFADVDANTGKPAAFKGTIREPMTVEEYEKFMAEAAPNIDDNESVIIPEGSPESETETEMEG